ncbi:hypothetical protein [Neobacillus mesonae]|uniref:Uncharacterized protein n=1 Tax=Neobacillus mesonae TaxID=1193713 RepID=A0A3T0I2E2_9BACI|nr:hypothetical protein [Neobacillus mesonae]AZU63511.1 hypothetical protein CHR53_20805 [Neobacillus mesonae]
MVTFIWAFCSMVVLMLIFYFLRIGYSLKAKAILVSISFLLSLGGLTVVAIIPLWQTALLLLLLSISAAYFMNSRMGALFMQQKPAFEEVADKELDLQEQIDSLENRNSINLVKIDEQPLTPNLISGDMNRISNIIEDTQGNELDIIVEDISLISENETELEINDPAENTSLQENESITAGKFATNAMDELLDEIASVEIQKGTNITDKQEEPLDDSLFDFLLAEKEVAPHKEEILETSIDNDYLSEIESLLEYESTDSFNKEEDIIIEEIDDLPVIDIQDANNLGKDEDQLDDSLFDFLLSENKEADRDDVLKVIDQKEKLSLQK